MLLQNIRLILRRLGILVLIYQLIRLMFLFVNSVIFKGVGAESLMSAFVHGLRFDLAAIAYVNAVYVLAWFFPVNFGRFENLRYKILRYWFVATNSFFILLSVGDVEYFQFSGGHLSLASFGIAGDIKRQALQLVGYYWVFALVFICYLAALWLLYGQEQFSSAKEARLKWWQSSAIFLGAILLTGLASRGGLQSKPLMAAHAYDSDDPRLAPLILNGTFTVIKSYKQKTLTQVSYIDSWEEIETLVEADVRPPAGQLADRKPNIVILILESFSLEYTGLSGLGVSYTPFLDKLAAQGISFPLAFANGRRSIDALPAILGSVPALMDSPFITSAYHGVDITGLPAVLKQHGYQTAFFHGGHDGTMFFDLMAKVLGFEQYFGASSFPDQREDDGRWGIYDEPFLQYSAQKMDGFAEPFLTSIFTLSSHQPYKIPEKYTGRFPKGTLEIHESIGYADYALERFFESASKKPWFKNTLFIVSADHTSKGEAPRFSTGIGRFRVPLIFYYPGGTLKLADRAAVAQHADIKPTVLDLLGIEEEKQVRFGRSLAQPLAERQVTLFEGDLYWLVTEDLALYFDPKREAHFYRWREDELLKNRVEPKQDQSEYLLRKLKAYIQYFNNGLLSNHLNL